jgi:hypothetical protein
MMPLYILSLIGLSMTVEPMVQHVIKMRSKGLIFFVGSLIGAGTIIAYATLSIRGLYYLVYLGQTP